MDWEFLVTGSNTEDPGKVVACVPAGYVWGSAEGPPDFVRVSFAGTEAESNHIRNNARYNLTHRKWVDKEDGVDLDLAQDAAEPEEPAQNDAAITQAEADSVAGYHVVDPVAYFQPYWADYEPSTYRLHWVKIVWSHRRVPTVKAFIAAVAGGCCFGRIRQRLLDIPNDIRKQFPNSTHIQQRDIDWMENVLKVPLHE